MGMSTFHLLGYTTDRPYSKQSQTNVGYFALLKATAVQAIYLGATTIPLTKLKFASAQPVSIYFGSLKIT